MGCVQPRAQMEAELASTWGLWRGKDRKRGLTMALRPLGTSRDVMAFTVQGCDGDLVTKFSFLKKDA